MDRSPDTVLQLAWGLWLISWLAAAWWSSPTVRRPRSSMEIAYRVFVALGAMFLFGLRQPWPAIDGRLWRLSPDVQWALVLIALCGFAFTWWARLVLGRLWSSGVTRKVDHSIVTSGPYRLVRHPIYSGILLAVLATTSIRGTAAACAGALLIGLGFFFKARVEERFLRAELGEERYGAYASRVPMLVPFVNVLRTSGD